jgi:hypothetical protein
MKERAVVLTVNLDTLEVLTTPFEGQDSIVRANQFMRGEQARGDFPLPWEWRIISNAKAREAEGERFVRSLSEGAAG